MDCLPFICLPLRALLCLAHTYVLEDIEQQSDHVHSQDVILVFLCPLVMVRKLETRELLI